MIKPEIIHAILRKAETYIDGAPDGGPDEIFLACTALDITDQDVIHRAYFIRDLESEMSVFGGLHSRTKRILWTSGLTNWVDEYFDLTGNGRCLDDLAEDAAQERDQDRREREGQIVPHGTPK